LPVYTCTTTAGKIDHDTKRELAAEITRIHARASSRITRLPEENVLVVIQSSPARFAVEGGRVLPEPGQEATWLAP
jgi:phenylpyruvate tautomerase PptA (4-oxalocrotonate tautomerase family)